MGGGAGHRIAWLVLLSHAALLAQIPVLERQIAEYERIAEEKSEEMESLRDEFARDLDTFQKEQEKVCLCSFVFVFVFFFVFVLFFFFFFVNTIFGDGNAEPTLLVELDLVETLVGLLGAANDRIAANCAACLGRSAKQGWFSCLFQMPA